MRPFDKIIISLLIIGLCNCKDEDKVSILDEIDDTKDSIIVEDTFQVDLDTLTFQIDSLGFRLDSTENYTSIFADNFDSQLSYYSDYTLNATYKEYGDNSLYRGHLLRLWNYSWDYSYNGTWTQAFYVVPPKQTFMEQAGRSAHTGNYRIIAFRAIPENLSWYEIRFRMQKNDNDAVFYHFGTDENGDGGIRWGYNSQVPDTDDTSSPHLYTRGPFGEHIVENKAQYGEWLYHTMVVYPTDDLLKWYINGDLVLEATSESGIPNGGHFAISQHYERSTRYDDFSIVGYE
ncbi:MAG: hypothetical protein CMB80_21100 [Flammeovirgaceae bacterium]|nr:hypothetical protein [Flammeovirgaceae bacterium]MBE62834.1 hypothetical protein [Flammeovirgaceae bacterium]MBR06821.1 hypothetical protein [Rickettsiales bacterium]